MGAEVVAAYRRAQDAFDAVLAAVPAGRWDAPSACALWTLRDVAGHLVWGQEQLRHWATGQPYLNRAGAPGASAPAALAGDDPVATWRAARARCGEALVGEALDGTVILPGLGVQPIIAVVDLSVTDHLAHAWDIAHALGVDLRLDLDLVAHSSAWARNHMVRVPGFFGPEQAVPAGADEQTRWLAFLGRAAWRPVRS